MEEMFWKADMLKRTEQIAIFLCVLLLSACKTAMILRGTDFPQRCKERDYRSWIDINTRSKTGEALSGELIAIQNDTLYILTSEQLTGIPSEKVKDAVLYIFINRSGSFAAVTSLVFVPTL